MRKSINQSNKLQSRESVYYLNARERNHVIEFA